MTSSLDLGDPSTNAITAIDIVLKSHCATNLRFTFDQFFSYTSLEAPTAWLQSIQNCWNDSLKDAPGTTLYLDGYPKAVILNFAQFARIQNIILSIRKILPFLTNDLSANVWLRAEGLTIQTHLSDPLNRAIILSGIGTIMMLIVAVGWANEAFSDYTKKKQNFKIYASSIVILLPTCILAAYCLYQQFIVNGLILYNSTQLINKMITIN